MTSPLSFSFQFCVSLFALFSSFLSHLGWHDNRWNQWLYLANHAVPISLCSSQAIRNQSEPPQTMLQCHRTPDRYWGIQLMSCITLGPPSIPLPTHSEQSKPRAQAGQTVTILQVWAQMKRSLGNTLNVCVWLIHTYRAITRPQLTWDREVLYRDCTTLKNFIDAPSH